jgi:hypothetical protein
MNKNQKGRAYQTFAGTALIRLRRLFRNLLQINLGVYLRWRFDAGAVDLDAIRRPDLGQSNPCRTICSFSYCPLAYLENCGIPWRCAYLKRYLAVVRAFGCELACHQALQREIGFRRSEPGDSALFLRFPDWSIANGGQVECAYRKS